VSNNRRRQEFYDLIHGSIRAAQNPGATTVDTPRGPLRVDSEGMVIGRDGRTRVKFTPDTGSPSDSDQPSPLD
jgi:hypothetical protein